MQPCLGDHLVIRAGYPLQPGHSLCHVQCEMRGHGCQLDGGEEDSERFFLLQLQANLFTYEKYPCNARPVCTEVVQEANQGLEMESYSKP